MAPRADVAIVGLGAVGAFAASVAARAGADVIGFDAYAPPHDAGSSHGETRLVRVAYAEGAVYVPLARRAVSLWRDMNARTGAELFAQRGVFYAAPPGASMIEGVRRSAEAHGLALERREAVAGIAAPPGWDGLYEPEGGYARVEDAIAAALDEAEAAGAALMRRTPVTAIERSAGGWTIETASGRFGADRLILAAGGWTGVLQPSLAPRLRIERRVQIWFAPGERPLDPSAAPAFAFQDETGDWCYGAPSPRTGGMKLGRHQGDDPVSDPDSVARQISDADLAPARGYAARYFPGAGPVTEAATCFYTMTPDGDFVIDDAISEEGRVTVAGLSGHGFKFAPALGEFAALRALGREAPVDLAPFSPARFA